MSILPLTDEWEFYGEPGLLPASDGDAVSLFDYSGNGRTLAITGTAPILKTNIVNGKAVIRFNGTTDPLANATNINFRCGFAVSKYSGATFSNYAGLLSGLNNFDLLTGSAGDTKFSNFLLPKFEFRSNDRIYPANQANAPMNAFKLTVFKFWGNSYPLDGIQLGKQRNLNGTKWNGDIGFLALTKRNLHEDIIADYTKKIALHFGLTMADVYPYQGDWGGHNEEPEIGINFYDPPEGERISEVTSPLKQTLDIKFTGADQTEIDTFKAFFNARFATAQPFIYRDYRFTPPRDFEGYFDSLYEIAGEGNDFSYGFKMREK